MALLSLIGAALALAGLAQLLRRTSGTPPPAEPGRHAVRVESTRRIVPGAGLPPEVRPMASNNNLDAVRHADGRVYLAFRTAPHHFASAETRIVVVSSADEERWRFEAEYQLATDLREPRLLSLGDHLFLYVSKLGSDPLAFEPRGMAFAERGPGAEWSQLRSMGRRAVMGWRVRRLGGVPVMLVYEGGADLYSGRRPDIRVELWKSADGRTWEPYDSTHPVLYRGGGSEADCDLAPDGSLYGVIRNEGGDATGWGAKICRAPTEDLANWTCVSDTRKYDSPFVFAHDGEVYLVARRNLGGHGDYDLGHGPGWLLRTVWNQVNYSLTRKRCALWRFVPGEDRLAWILDLPSRGDTCFPAVLAGSEPGEVVVYDYSSPLDGPDVAWLRGQRGETGIYRHVLRFEPR